MSDRSWPCIYHVSSGKKRNEAAGSEGTTKCRGFRLSFEMEAQADDDRESQTRAVVVDVLEPGADELIHLREPADVAQSELAGYVDLIGDANHDAGVDAPGERRGAVEEVGAGEDRIGLGRGELD